jgi:(+)-pinoresinol hydroxylase
MSTTDSAKARATRCTTPFTGSSAMRPIGRTAIECALVFVFAASACLPGAFASAGPVSSAQNAWAPLPASAGAPLKDPREQRGREVFQQRCAACHAAIPKDGIGPPYLPAMAGTQALQARYKGAKPAELEQRTDLTADFVKAIVRGGLNSMPFFRPTELSDEDLQALGAYLTRKRR